MTDQPFTIRRRDPQSQLRYLAGKLIEAHDRLIDVNQTHTPERVMILAVAIALDAVADRIGTTEPDTRIICGTAHPLAGRPACILNEEHNTSHVNQEGDTW